MVFCGEENNRNSDSPRFVIINDEKYVEIAIACNVKRLIEQHLVPPSTAFGMNVMTVDEFNDSCKMSIPSSSYLDGHSKSQKAFSQHHCESEEDDDREDMLYIDCDSLTSESITNGEILVTENKSTIENNAQGGDGSSGIINIYQKHVAEENLNYGVLSLKKSKCLDKLLKDFKFVEFENEEYDSTSKNATKTISQEENPTSYVMWFTNAPDAKMIASDHFPLIKLNSEIPSAITTDVDTINEKVIDITKYRKMVECPYCNFKIHNSVTRHLLLHLRVCFCILCKKVMSLKEAVAHLRGETCIELVCLKCPFKSNNEKKMQTHIVGAHKDSLMSQCSLCGYKTINIKTSKSTLTTLKEHVHSEHCGKKFPVSPWFILKESNNKYQDLYHCPNCSDKVFHNLTDLLHHVSKCQSSEKHFKCKICKFKHHSEVWMKLHKRTHSLHKYKCPFCKYRTIRHFMLKYHLKKSHQRMSKKISELRISSCSKMKGKVK